MSNTPLTPPWRSIPCPLCRSEQAAVVTRDWLTVGATRYTFTLRRCRNCGLVYVNPRLDRGAPGLRSGSGARREAMAANKEIYRAGCRRLRQLLGRPERPRAPEDPLELLDIGCAYGDFLVVAGEAGFRASGVEIDAPSAAIAGERGFRVYPEPLERLGLAAGSFAAVTLWDVIEHVEDPVSLVREAARVLRPGGVLLLHTGNAAFQVPKGKLLARLRPGRGPNNAPLHHLCHFSTRTCRQLLAAADCLREAEFDHLGTIRYERRGKRWMMSGYNRMARFCHRLGGPLWTSSLAAFALKGGSIET